MNLILSYLTFILIIKLCYPFHLNSNQKATINKILSNQSASLIQKNIVKKILYKSYEKFAIKQANEFKKTHYYKCRDIHNDEIQVYAKYGLWKSITKFKGYISLDKFSLIYIKSELYKMITDKYSCSILPKSIRIKSKKKLSYDQRIKYNYLLKTYITSNDWVFDKLNIEQNSVLDNIYFKDSFEQIWNIIHNSDLFDYKTKRILSLKYDFEFNKIRSNKKISEIIGYSEEYVRIKYNKSLDELKKIYPILNSTCKK